MIESETPVPDAAESAVSFEAPTAALEPADHFSPTTIEQIPAADPVPAAGADVDGLWVRAGREIVSGIKTLVSAAVYATLIVTFGFQVARVDGLSMAPTLEDHDRLIVNKLVYEIGDPRPGDIVMLYYPLNPEKMFVKRVIAKEGDTVRIVDGHVDVNGIPLHDDYVPQEFRSHDDWGPQVVQQGYYFVMGITATTARTAATGDPCRRSTSSARSRSAGGPFRTPRSSSVRPDACVVVIGPAGTLPALTQKAAALGEVLAFGDADARKALETIRAAKAGRVRARTPVCGDPARRGAHQPREIRSVTRGHRDPRDRARQRLLARVTPEGAGKSAAARPAGHSARAPLQGRLEGAGFRRHGQGDAHRSLDDWRAAHDDAAGEARSECPHDARRQGRECPIQRGGHVGLVRDPPNGAPRYRAGLEFSDADSAAVDAFIGRHKAT